MLYESFSESLNSTNWVALNYYLQSISEVVKAIDRASNSDNVLENYVRDLCDIIKIKNFPLKGQLTNQFIQKIGEAHFYLLCKTKGISLSRIPESSKGKTPDFLFTNAGLEVNFEVKTLSVVDGGSGMDKDINNSFKAHLVLDQQIQSKKKVAIAESIVQPFGIRPHIKGTKTAVIETLLEKVRQNIKPGQFQNPNTFLVLSFCCLGPITNESDVLRPVYPDDYMFPKCISGELWMLAFGRPGMLILGNPEFEGKPCVEGFFDKAGILADNEFESIKGLLFIVYPMGRAPEIWGLFRSRDHLDWQDNNKGLLSVMHQLTADNWNDELDVNGFELLPLSQ